MREKILLDTDIGYDIDDAVCLAYLLANPNCELLGITTVTGQAAQRAAMASAMCRVAGQAVPIFPGIEDPILHPQQQPLAPQAAVLAKYPHQTNFPKGEAIEFMRQTIRAHPHEVTLLAIGPLTNVAALFMIDDEIAGLLKGLVLMCGTFLPPMIQQLPMEWNAKLDPLATAVSYRAQTKLHRSIGLDVTMQLTMPADEVSQRFQHPLLRPVLDFAEIWFEKKDQIVFHDPLAAATIFDDGICQFERGHVEPEWQDEARLGAMNWQPDPAGRHEVAVSVDADRFFEHYFGMFG